MRVTITNNDNTKTTYSFDPQHEKAAIDFYGELYTSLVIQGFEAVLANGQTVSVGTN